MGVERTEFRARLNCLSAAQRLFAEWFSQTDMARETLWVAHLDRDSNCLELSRFEGHEQSVLIPVHTIIADVIRHLSTGIILAHNHPSGDARPSESDCRSTMQLAAVANGLNCAVVDHLIFAGGNWTSFRMMGLL